MTVSTELTFSTATVKVDETPHVLFLRHECIGFQSWKSRTIYVIELTFKSGATIELEYDRRDLWQLVLGELCAILKDVVEHT